MTTEVDPSNLSDCDHNYNSNNYQTIAQSTLPNQLDCITFNPTRENLFVLGTYEIDSKNSERRLGKIILSQLVSTAENGYKIVYTVNNLHGILDLKWETSGQLLAAASSASVAIYRLNGDEDTDGLELVPVACVEFDGTLEMALYLQWMNPSRLVYSTSTGMICLWDWKFQEVPEDSETPSICTNTPENLEVMAVVCSVKLKLHEYFVWFVHYDDSSNVIYSGDDSGVLCALHLDNFEATNTEALTKKQFDTGVTSILTKGNWLFVGCYDEKLRIFTRAIRDFDKKIIIPRHALQEISLGGTVWRTLWMHKVNLKKEDVHELAIAAGRNGIHFISIFPDENWNWATSLSVLEYQGDLAYGLDLKIYNCTESNAKKLMVGTCYFDSKRLHIFEMNF